MRHIGTDTGSAATPRAEKWSLLSIARFWWYWREVGLRVALDVERTILVCRLRGHRWGRETHFESWDVGVGYESEWWACERCEAFSHSRPEGAS